MYKTGHSNEPLLRAAYKICVADDIGFDIYYAFTAHFNSANRRGIRFNFTFLEWYCWWMEDDRWSRRGVGKGKFVMGRKQDQGEYSLENVICISHSQNLADVDKTPVAEKLRAKWQAKTPEERAQHHLAKRGDEHPRSRAVITPQGRYGSARMAAEAHGFSAQYGQRLAKCRLQGWAYEDELRSTGDFPPPAV